MVDFNGCFVITAPRTVLENQNQSAVCQGHSQQDLMTADVLKKL
jgi:hypothetical protein